MNQLQQTDLVRLFRLVEEDTRASRLSEELAERKSEERAERSRSNAHRERLRSLSARRERRKKWLAQEGLTVT